MIEALFAGVSFVNFLIILACAGFLVIAIPALINMYIHRGTCQSHGCGSAHPANDGDCVVCRRPIEREFD